MVLKKDVLPRKDPNLFGNISYVAADGLGPMSSVVSADSPNFYTKWRTTSYLKRISNERWSDEELSSEIKETFERAKAFVEQEVGLDLRDVELRATPSLADSGLSGAYSIASDSIVLMRQNDLEEGLLNSYDIQRLSDIFVHELMHATGYATAAAMNIRSHKSPRNIVLRNGCGFFDVRGDAISTLNSDERMGGRVGLFFEEAFAEEGAARWREQQLGALDGVVDFNRTPSLPHRLVLMGGDCGADPAQFELHVPAYAAAALQHISTYTGVDVYSLIRDSRTQVNEAEGRRALIQVIDSVQKGLYRKLRDAPYTEEGFVEAYKEAIIAIRRDMEKRKHWETLLRPLNDSEH